MASRTIEQERDRKMTIMTTCFIPCGAKMPIVGLIAGALFGGSAWIATSAYFIGVGAVIVSGIILKKTKAFRGEASPFVMELPPYHFPIGGNVFRATWERGWSFIKKAGTIILAASVIVWVLNNLTFEGGFHYIGDGDETSVLNVIGSWLALFFIPLGFGSWQAAVATLLGLVAKEEVVGVFGSLGLGSAETALFQIFQGNQLAAFSFMIFNLLCAPCFAAMGAIKREMNNAKWTAGALGYMTAFAYAISLIVYQLGTLITGGAFTLCSGASILVLLYLGYLLFRPDKGVAK
jgi:ferrous iron transport protein B